MNGSRLNLPNLITVARIAVCPVIFWLAISPDAEARLAAFALFVTAALSDVWDGYLARRYDLITDMGKLLDPIADKLLLVVTLIPIYIVSNRDGGPPVPWWGPLPTWILIVIFGREALMTVFRAYAARRGVVIAAGAAGKRKAMFQMFFIGGFLLWYPLSDAAAARGWSSTVWAISSEGIRAWVGITLAVALVLTVYSMIDYLWSYRRVVGIED